MECNFRGRNLNARFSENFLLFMHTNKWHLSTTPAKNYFIDKITKRGKDKVDKLEQTITLFLKIKSSGVAHAFPSNRR